MTKRLLIATLQRQGEAVELASHHNRLIAAAEVLGFAAGRPCGPTALIR